ncbi:YcaO-like family protein [Rhizobium viscosum]|uniref:Ribosomal protein S12 methylthiotransferase accessory factor n=1 Tax=Rhizobium viscosum TaxID=1673 RepID=A0ABR9J183_RHIVS|nr:ribosomal protein S12 methylthiotransferase accessory factor [Rhizobium viscosum]
MLSAFYAGIKDGSASLTSPESDPEDAEAYFRSLLPLCRRARITRIADLTGLDRIGLPIIQAIRPAALSEVTSLGRGMSKVSAAIGAIMESLERFYAEAIPAPRVFLSTAERLEIGAGFFDGFIPGASRENWREREIAWIMGVDVTTGALTPAPFELVHTVYTDPPPPHDGVFLRTTTGLACHRTDLAALLHGLLECVERDAMARAFETHGLMDRMRLPSSGLSAAVQDLLSRLAGHGISAAFWYAPSPARIPVAWCQTIEAGEGEPTLTLPTEGYCAGLDIHQAAFGALLEALAARAGAISGARDDQTRRHYSRPRKAMLLDARDLILGKNASTTDFPSVLPPVTDFADLLGRIIVAGLGPVLAVPIASQNDPNVHCVRTILAGMRPFAVER